MRTRIRINGGYVAVGEPPADELVFDLMNRVSRGIEDFIRQGSRDTLCHETARDI